MASIRSGTTADGRTYYSITVSRGRNRSQITRRWYPDPEWTEKRTEKELEREALRLESAAASGELKSMAEMAAERALHPTLRSYVEETWMPMKAPQLAWNTVETYRRNFRLHVFPVLGDELMEQVTPAQITRLVASLRQSRSAATAQLVYSQLSAVFHSAMVDGVIERSPFDRCSWTVTRDDRTRAKEAAESRALSADELAQIMRALPDQAPDVQAFTLLGLDAGLRIGEALALQWSSIDWTAGTVTVSGQAQRRTGEGMVITAPKSAAGLRTVAIGGRTLEALKALRSWQGDTGISPWVFAGKDRSRPVSSTTARDWMKRLGVPGLHPHMLRHTAATSAILAGADIASVSRRLGHSDIAVTLRTYTHPDAEAQARAGDLGRRAMGL